jgi:hypothetical protein
MDASMKYQFRLAPYTSTRTHDSLSITKTGRIGLPKYFIANHDVQPPARANLYWNSASRSIAIQLVTVRNAETFPVVFTKQFGAAISARRFFAANNVPLDQHVVGRYEYSKLPGKAVGIAEASSSVFLIQLPSADARSLSSPPT